MIKVRALILGLLYCSLVSFRLTAQVLALKTNVLADAIVSPNANLEVKLGSRFTLDVSGHYYPFSSKESFHRWKHWLLQPEFRFWFCKPFAGHFLGVYTLAGEYNIAGRKLPFGWYKVTRSSRYEGFVMGAGFSYGYQWILSPRWGMETEIGAGYVYADYSRYRCPHCGEKMAEGHKNYLGPTKVAVSIVYLLK